jgi:putative acetyltransferase
VVREAAPADVEAIVELLRDVAAENRWVRTEVPFDLAGRRRHLIDGMTAGGLIAFVAEIDGAIAGELSLRIHGERAVFGMVVALTQRRRGLGRQLVTAAIAKARERGVSSIEIEVYAHNRAAIELYVSLGFVKYGDLVREERHDGRRWNVVRMRLDNRRHHERHN